MNPMVGEWHQLKTHEIAGQMFDNSYDLAIFIEAEVENRYLPKGYNVEGFIFNSA